MSVVSRYLDPNLIQRLNHLQLSARRVVEGVTTGVHKSQLKGASVEFRQHRAYVPGDEPRRLDWRVLGRTDRPYVREFDEETNLRCLIVLDGSGSMGYRRGQERAETRRHEASDETKFDYAARMTASFSYLMLGQTESVGIATIGKGIDQFVAPKAGTTQLSRILETLDHIQPHGAADLPEALHEIAQRLERRALVIVISDWFSPVEPIRKSLAHLKHDGHELIALQVLDQDELEFPFDKWLRIKGLEGEKSILCEPALARKTYLQNFQRHEKELNETCRTLGVEFHRFLTNQPLIDALTRYLNRRMG